MGFVIIFLFWPFNVYPCGSWGFFGVAPLFASLSFRSTILGQYVYRVHASIIIDIAFAGWICCKTVNQCPIIKQCPQDVRTCKGFLIIGTLYGEITIQWRILLTNGQQCGDVMYSVAFASCSKRLNCRHCNALMYGRLPQVHYNIFHLEQCCPYFAYNILKCIFDSQNHSMKAVRFLCTFLIIMCITMIMLILIMTIISIIAMIVKLKV